MIYGIETEPARMRLLRDPVLEPLRPARIRWRRARWLAVAAPILIGMVALAGCGEAGSGAQGDMECLAPYAIDGDTIRCAGWPANVRLLGIDAPEMPGHCRQGRVCTPGSGGDARREMGRLLASGSVQCQSVGYDRYQRILARCTAGTVDVSCAMLDSGQAVRRYARVEC